MDVGTGNIDFVGDVVIHGSVKTGARIRAAKSITIDGVCEGCVLEAGNDLILRNGMIGMGKAWIIVKGNLFAKFMEYTDVEVDGFVEADSAINCNVVSNDKVIFNGGHASIVGGKYMAVQALRCKTWVMMPLSRLRCMWACIKD